MSLWNLELYFLENCGVTARRYFPKVCCICQLYRDQKVQKGKKRVSWLLTKFVLFDAGFKSRVRYTSVLDPTNMCYYLSEILDAGQNRPLFMVIQKFSYNLELLVYHDIMQIILFLFLHIFNIWKGFDYCLHLLALDRLY